MSDIVPLEKINSHLARMGIKMRSRLRAVAEPSTSHRFVPVRGRPAHTNCSTA